MMVDHQSSASDSPAPSSLARRAQLVPADPLLSVVMPVFNERTTIEETIRRVLAVHIRIELICQGRADVVYGSRFLGRHRVFPFSHYLGNRLITLAANVLYNTMLTDMETCYKVMRTDVLRAMTLKSDGFGIEPEITAKVFKRGYRVYEIPISYDGRGYQEGKKITWRDGIVALWILLKYRFTE